MEHAQVRISDWLIAGLVPLAVVAAMPLVGALVFVLRPVVLFAGLGGLLVGSLLYVGNSRVRRWVDAAAETLIGYRGLRLARDLAFHPSHSWARLNDVVVVGADDVAQATLGPVAAVDLPPVGQRVRRGDPLLRLRSGRRQLEIRAPISGTVVGRNEALRQRPDLVNHHPFDQGWAVRLRGDDLEGERTLLLRGRAARRWFRRDVDRIIATLPTDGPEAPVLPDGAVRAAELHHHIDDAAWSRLTETVFAAAPTAPETAT